MLWILISVGFTLAYLLLIAFYQWQWNGIPRETPAIDGLDVPKVSVIIVGRNEAATIPACLNSIYSNAYPPGKLEIIFVDDHSDDNSLSILKSYKNKGLQIVCLSDHLNSDTNHNFKKRGIEIALGKASGQLILHTDADTVVGKQWIKQHVSSYQKGYAFTAAPVLFHPVNGFLQHFQQLDFLVTMGVTGAGIVSGLHFLANGANMSYNLAERRKIVSRQGEQFASGDDVFLVQAFGINNKTPDFAEASSDKRVNFVRDIESIVYTYPEKTWKAFFNQRFRWAGKSRAYRDKKLQMVEILVFGMNATLLANAFLAFIFPGLLILFLFQLLLKFIVDSLFIRSVACDWQISLSNKQLFFSLLFYPVYYILIGISVILPLKKTWKGRAIN